jgi:2-polyprenyl-3-methyl-5-hydroxy-6-metoxy-1,4-benzoquinol methylase
VKALTQQRCRFDGGSLVEVFAYDRRPEGETRFAIAENDYRRAYDRCETCGHYFARHTIDLSRLYETSYVDATYGGVTGMKARLERIRALPPELSDNAGRAARIDAFAAQANGRRLLDVGAGIGVFPASMLDRGWTVDAIELDTRTAEHLREVLAIAAYTDDLQTLATRNIGRFDAITFNKVIEHVEDPVAILRDAIPLMAEGGFVYVEVPDVAAAIDGRDREEFFIEHLHVFSPSSLIMTIEKAGLAVFELERIGEPSGKYTLFAFAKAVP